METALLTIRDGTTVNQHPTGARQHIGPGLLDIRPRINGKLDLENAPMRLLAIANRHNLFDEPTVSFGAEGRIVFGGVRPDGSPMEFTIIFEYDLPVTSSFGFSEWAQAWHALRALPFPSEQYNAALQTLIERFTLRGVMPGKPNGSALSQMRTNEIEFDDQDPQNGATNRWQLREFAIDQAGALVPTTIKQTPSQIYSETEPLRQWVRDNAFKILGDFAVVPPEINTTEFGTLPFLTGETKNDGVGAITVWNFEPIAGFSPQPTATCDTSSP